MVLFHLFDEKTLTRNQSNSPFASFISGSCYQKTKQFLVQSSLRMADLFVSIIFLGFLRLDLTPFSLEELTTKIEKNGKMRRHLRLSGGAPRVLVHLHRLLSRSSFPFPLTLNCNRMQKILSSVLSHITLFFLLFVDLCWGFS